MDPQYGANLTIDGKKISDRAVVFKNGSVAVAYVWDDSTMQTFYDESGVAFQVPREPGNEVIAELVQVTEEKGGRLTGIDKETLEPSTWVVADSNKKCKGCPG